MQKYNEKLIRKVLYITIYALIFLGPQFAKAQDPIFSQFYIDPIQINPGFTGNTYVPKIGLSYRMQWPLTSFAYNTYSASYDQYFDQANSGFGMNILSDNAGNGILVHNKISLFYAYRMRLGNNSYLKVGIDAAFVQNRLDWDQLIFSDQLDAQFGAVSPGGSSIPSSEIQPEQLSNNYMDASFGLLYFNPNYYIGASAKHLNTPNDNFLDVNANLFSGLPVRISFQAGGEIPVGNYNIGGLRSFISPNILYVRQGEFAQLNVGAYANLGVFFLGTWYRHANTNSDALIFSTGIKQGSLKIGYSFDLTISQLSINSGGAHEIGISFLIGNEEKRTDYNDCFQLFR